MLRRRGGRGVVNTMARTAVIARTATAVSNKVSAAGAAKAQAAHQQQNAQQELAQMQEQLAAQETVIDASGMTSTIEKLKELALLKDAGMLTEEEFALAKSKVLAG